MGNLKPISGSRADVGSENPGPHPLVGAPAAARAAQFPFPTQDEFGLRIQPGLKTFRARIERAWTRLHTVIPASSADSERRRTPYFYRQMAIRFAQGARHPWFKEMGETYRSLAKSYLATYRRMKGNPT